MPADAPADQTLASLIELAFLTWGAVIWWRFQFVSSTAPYRVLRLPRRSFSLEEFLFKAFLVFFGALTGGALTALIISLLRPSLKSDVALATVLEGAGIDLGALGLLLCGRKMPAWLKPAQRPDPLFMSTDELPRVAEPVPLLPFSKIPAAGLFTYLAALPLVAIIQEGWSFVLERLHVKAPHQVLIDLVKDTHGVSKLILFFALTVVIGPSAEELVFRAGIFRALRQRAPRWSAYLITSVLFALLHGNLSSFLPLVLFAYVLTLSYERTGRIAVPIIAHALFNLTTMVFLLTGQVN